MNPILATTHGNGPYYPVACYQGRAYVLGGAFEDMGDALKEAQVVIERIRDDMRAELPEGYTW